MASKWEPILEDFATVHLEYDYPVSIAYAADWLYVYARGKCKVSGKLPDNVRLCRQVEAAPTWEVTEARVEALRWAIGTIEMETTQEDWDAIVKRETLREMLREIQE